MKPKTHKMKPKTHREKHQEQIVKKKCKEIDKGNIEEVIGKIGSCMVHMDYFMKKMKIDENVNIGKKWFKRLK